MSNVIGIDLGTTNSCVAIFKNGMVEIIPCNEDGKRTMPSMVAFTDHERLIGEQAKDQMATNRSNTVYDAKRLIGRKWNDESVQEDIRLWPFDVIGDDKNWPRIRVQHRGETSVYRPEEISAMILEKIKKVAEEYTGKPIDGAVVTVPAYFNNAQREATKIAAEIAQLNIMRIINEPTAAAIAYGFQTKDNVHRSILVFDLGGGTFDVTIMELDDGVYEVKATSGNTHLGGEDFDSKMVEYCLNDIKSRFKKDISDDNKVICRLRVQCERAKIALSQGQETSINLESLFDDKDYQLKFSRQRFEDINMHLFQQLLEPVDRALEDAQIDPTSLDDIVFIGGSTRIPKIQEFIRKKFDKCRINNDINPDEAVAHGAAILAAKIGAMEPCEALQEMVLLDVTPLSLGIETVGGVMSVIIPRNTTVPVTRNRLFTTHKDHQTSVRVQVFEGERRLTKDNNLLGDFRVTGLRPVKFSDAQIEVAFNVDTNGILTVTAKCLGEATEKRERIENQLSMLSKDEVEELIERAKAMRLDDDLEKERITSRVILEHLCYRYRSEITSPAAKGKVAGSEREKVLTKVAETISWIETYPGEKREKYEEVYKEVHNFCDPFRQKMFDNGPGCREDNIQEDYDAME